MKIYRYFACVILLCAGLLLSSCVKSETALLAAVEVPQTTPVPTPNVSIPEGWTLFPKPKQNSKEAQCANYSMKEWSVETENGQVKISPSDRARAHNKETEKLPIKLREYLGSAKNIGNGKGELHVEAFENGWLIGSDAGEWGGKLMWYNEDGSRQKELINDNIRGIAKVGGEILVLSGLAHLSMDEGKIWKLGKDEKGEIKATLLKDLGSQPQGFVVKDKDLLVALNNKFLRISLSGDITVLNETSFSSFYPNSMTLDPSGVVYVGARHFVVRFVPGKDGYKEEWLVPKNCQKFFVKEKELDCVCQN